MEWLLWAVVIKRAGLARFLCALLVIPLLLLSGRLLGTYEQFDVVPVSDASASQPRTTGLVATRPSRKQAVAMSSALHARMRRARTVDGEPEAIAPLAEKSVMPLESYTTPEGRVVIMAPSPR
jgi:hypothetical protein